MRRASLIRAAALALATLPAIACATAVDLAKVGLGTADVLRLERDHWELEVRSARLDPATQPLAVRDLSCRRDRSFGHLYRCDYAVDYGLNGATTGTVERRNRTIGRDKGGPWAFFIILS